MDFVAGPKRLESRSYIIDVLTAFICLEFANDRDVRLIRTRLDKVDRRTLHDIFRIYKMRQDRLSGDSVKHLCHQFLESFYLHYL